MSIYTSQITISKNTLDLGILFYILEPALVSGNKNFSNFTQCKRKNVSEFYDNQGTVNILTRVFNYFQIKSFFIALISI